MSTTAELNLQDVPDLSGVLDDNTSGGFTPFEDGWYNATFQKERTFTNKSGAEVVFESSDRPTANDSGRMLRLQVKLRRNSDGRTNDAEYRVFYRPGDLTTDSIAKVRAHAQAAKDSGEPVQWGELFGPFMTLQKLAALQQIAGVKSFPRTEDGGIDVSALYGKTAFALLGPDNRNPQYKEIKRVATKAPRGKTVV